MSGWITLNGIALRVIFPGLNHTRDYKASVPVMIKKICKLCIFITGYLDMAI